MDDNGKFFDCSSCRERIVIGNSSICTLRVKDREAEISDYSLCDKMTICNWYSKVDSCCEFSGLGSKYV